ncbi:regulatory protein [Blastomyces gilchristii SLH14081]|uniref:Regulatory protein n=1 Tax=Blastomyces gilchristii (strain SLH14081) TaxID=559298 RepID=A0A179USQ0_BLAGS|nr:regulatory protein [Blastomyces gilchristii SLH14081]OAT11145.1 regulatory protein [Blastomyces gilchristii SLH14081]
MLNHPTAKQEEPQEGTQREPAPTATKKPKRFQCMRCETRFARLEHLQRHERIHTQEKPFCCQLCDHRFTRSDLLIRHERLSHNKDGLRKKQPRPPKPRKSMARKSTPPATASHPIAPIAIKPSPMDDRQRTMSLGSDPHLYGPVYPRSEASNYPLATLTMVAEQVASKIPDKTVNTHAYNVKENTGLNQSEPAWRLSGTPAADSHAINVDLKHSIDALATFLDDGAHHPYQFSPFVSVEQPVPFSWLESTSHPDGPDANIRPSPTVHYKSNADQAGSFARFDPHFSPALTEKQKYQTEHTIPQRKPLSEVSSDDRQSILSRLEEYYSVIPAGFQLPSRLALSRYIARYISGFHEHLPFLHISTMSISSCAVELILAMAAAGAQYCFEDEKAAGLFYASKEIAMERIGRRGVNPAANQRNAKSGLASSVGGTDNDTVPRPHQYHVIHKRHGVPPESALSPLVTQDQHLIQQTQALLILMALATWAKGKDILREAVALQSVLCTLVLKDGLHSQPAPHDISWNDWIELECIKRTKFVTYCCLNLHSIVYNIPSPILNSELNLYLPCSAAEFEAPNRHKWLEARAKASPQINFQEALNRLFSHGGNEITECNSALGNYILIHAIIQYVFFLRHFSRGRFDGNRDVAPEDVAATEQALRNWQIGWKRNPQLSLDPHDPDGPVAFNSIALLRLAYIRLNIDAGPGMLLDTRDPVLITRTFRANPRVKRTPKLVRAVLHSAQALSIPVKIGIRLVAQRQMFVWSIQHSLCSLECALLLSRWLEALSQPNPEPPVSEDERRIGTLLKVMLDETEFAIAPNLPLGSPAMIRQMNAGVLRVWAKIFKGAQSWAILDIIGDSLNLYADMLEEG